MGILSEVLAQYVKVLILFYVLEESARETTITIQYGDQLH